jgi:NAD+ synthase
MSQQIDIHKAIDTISRFISDKLDEAGTTGYVVGLSGGIDSAVSASIAVKAVGNKRVMGILMPYRTSSEISVIDATTVAEKLGIECRKIDISPMIDAYYSDVTSRDRIRLGNKMARERMAILFDIAYETNRLVLGTGNRSEISLGYTTWYGDAACSIDPIGELYKNEVVEIAFELGIPEQIINKPPSADLWGGQTDEDEIGVRYELIDRLLVRLLDDGITSRATLVADGFNNKDIDRIISLLNKNAFKRRLPDIALLGRKPIPDTIKLSE